MSTKKVKDVPSKVKSLPSRTKKTTEVPKESKKSTSTLKKQEHEDEKDKATKKKILNNRTVPVRKPRTSSKPVTQPSNRIIKSQYFPSKQIYSNALKLETKERKVEKNRPVSPISDVSEASAVSERPRTATLGRGSIVNKNIAGPDIPVPIRKNKETKKKIEENPVPKEIPLDEIPIEENNTSNQDTYDDDFDSYESDFEQYVSSDSTRDSSSSSSLESLEFSTQKQSNSAGTTDDEKKLDSGNYELPESRHRHILSNIKESIEKENALLNEPKSHLGSLSDEGFEEGKSLQFINFLGAKQKYKQKRNIEQRRKRGEEILSMIRLDYYSFTLYELPPVPYEDFIKNYGRSNTIQTSVQTGDDDVDDGSQTDTISYADKWTQFPPSPIIGDTTDENFWWMYKTSYLGVGGTLPEAPKPEVLNEVRLEQFLKNVADLISELQSEASLNVKRSAGKRNIPFSKGYLLFETQNQSFLRNRPLKYLSFSTSVNKFLTVHGVNEYAESVICLWSVSNAENPEMVLRGFGEVDCCVCSPECPHLVFGGHRNGSLSVWDMGDSTRQKIVKNDLKETFFNPSYVTEINYGHLANVVCIKPLLKPSTQENFFNSQKPSEICSLDENGEIIIWGVVFKSKNFSIVVENQGLAHWGTVILVINTKISLKSLYPKIIDFRCTDFGVSQLDSNKLYISTSYGIIVHCLASGDKMSVNNFLPEAESVANCVEMCPISPEFFLSGFGNGNISFYSRAIKKPLITLSNKDSIEGRNSIQIIQWSQNHPLRFYTKDISNTIHVWNLKVSDLSPTYAVPFKENIIQIVVSSNVINRGLEESYMLIASDTGKVFVHVLDEGDDKISQEQIQEETKKFLNYINRYI